MKHITYYGNGCPQCKQLLSVLDAKNIPYIKIVDIPSIMKVAKEQDFNMMPILEIGEDFYAGMDAVNKAKEL